MSNEDTQENRILIVDDDLGYAEIMKRYLRDFYDIEIVSSGKQALNYLFFNEVDLVLLDIDMPGIDGFETYDNIKQMKNGSDIPIIFSTGVRNKATILRTVSKKAEGCLIKPTSRNEMLQRVEDAIKKYKREKNKKRILIVDDDLEFLTIIKGYLSSIYNVDVVNTYNLALDYLVKKKPDLVLLDYEMPIYNGMSLLGLIRGKRGFEKIPIMMVSGNTDPSLIADLHKCNIQGYIKKPVSKEIIIDKVEIILKGSE